MSANVHKFSQPISVASALPARQLTIAVAGNPNAGKTSLFNALTGMRQKVANYPGVTVERKEGLWSLAPDCPPALIIDLPGLYSLEATSLDEEIARDVLLGRSAAIAKPDVVVVVVDATSLIRNLFLATQLLESGCRVVIALTMFDLAERSHLKIDVAKLRASLGVPVVPVVAKQRRGLDQLAASVMNAIAAATTNGSGLTNGQSAWQARAARTRLQIARAGKESKQSFIGNSPRPGRSH